MTTKEFKQAYKHFLINVTKHSKHTADKYVSYINKACTLPGMHNLWDRIAFCDDMAKKILCVEELCDAIASAFDDPACTIKEKDLRDSQSSAHVLLAFVSNRIWTKHKGVQVSFVQIFSHKALISKFKQRLRTQDRLYAFGAFPIDLICKIATKHKLRTLWDELIAQTKFVYDAKGNVFPFKDISCVLIGDDHRAYFERDGQIHTTFTKIAGSTTFDEIRTMDIRDLSLDHDIPVEKALRATLESGAMSEFQKLSNDIIHRFVPIYKAFHSRAKVQDIISAYGQAEYDPVRLNIDEPAMLQEVQDFLGTLSLTIMDQKQNSAKSNRT